MMKSITSNGFRKVKNSLYDIKIKIFKPKQKKDGYKISAKMKERGFIIFFLSFAIINFLVFWVYVNINSILMAFQINKNGTTTWSFKNFAMLLNEMKHPLSVIREALVNTLIFFSTNLFITVPLTFLFSFFLYKRISGYKFFRYVFFLPSIISAVVLTSLFKYLLGTQGPIPIIWENLFGVDAPLFLASEKYALNTIVFYTIWTGFGTNLVLFNGAMSRIPIEITESANLEGVTLFREMFSIVIPLVWPTISTIIIFAFVGIFSASGPILLFTKGSHNTFTISYWIFDQVNEGGSYEYASAVGLFFTIIAVPIVMLVKYGMEHLVEDIEY